MGKKFLDPTELINDSERLLKVLHKSIDVQPASSQSSSNQIPRKRSTVAWVLSLAALIVVGLVHQSWLLPLGNSSQIAWTSQTFGPSTNRQEFFARLIKPPERWLEQNPTTPEQLATNLSAFRQGCNELVLHKNGIPEQDREWLVLACQKWSERLDELLVEVKDLSKPKWDHSFKDRFVLKQLTCFHEADHENRNRIKSLISRELS